MVRTRKVWGVLGLLLALVVVIGYGQEPRVPVKQTWVLTVNHNCTRAANGRLELFVRDNDVHPTRNITYQNNPASVGFPQPDNPPQCPGVAYFFPGWPDTVPPYYGGVVQVYFHGLPNAYTPTLCFREFPPPPPSNPNPALTITATASFTYSWTTTVTISTNPSANPAICQCVTGPALNVPTNPYTHWVKWSFTITGNSVEFCRLEVKQL